MSDCVLRKREKERKKEMDVRKELGHRFPEIANPKMAFFRKTRKATIHRVRHILLVLSVALAVSTLLWQMLLLHSTNEVLSAAKASPLSSQRMIIPNGL